MSLEVPGRREARTSLKRRSSSVKRSGSFKIKRMGNIVVCESCGQGHEPGKKHLYDYPDNTDSELLCRICLQPLVDPVDTSCSHTFCRVCIRSHLRMQRTCPADRQPLREKDIKPSSFLVRRILDKLTVVCPNNAYCDQVMPRSSLEVHLKYQCQGTYISCPNEGEGEEGEEETEEKRGCDFIGPRCQLEDHLWSCYHGNDFDRKTGLKRPIVEGQATDIEIPKAVSDLGLSISCSQETPGMVVEEIFPEGNAYRDGRLVIGDRILRINDEDFTQSTLARATLALSATTPLMRLTIMRDPLPDEADTELVELVRTEGKPLGIQIRTSRRPGIFVHVLITGSKAEECALIHPGDQILEANGHDLRAASVDNAATLMTQGSGSLKLLLAHHHQRASSSACSDLSLRSNLSSVHSCPSGGVAVGVVGGPIYDEILAPTGYHIGEHKTVVVVKQPDESFGMNVAGGRGCQCGDLPVFVSALRPDSVVARNGKIQCGDILLTINGVSLVSKTHVEAIQTIKSVTPVATVTLELLQGEETTENGGLSPDWPLWLGEYEKDRKSPTEYSITLQRRSKESLGFSIVGGANSTRGNSPVYVRNVAPKSIAARDGRLKSGDMILRINNVPVPSLSQNQVVQFIKSLSGTVALDIIPCDTQV